MIYICIYYVLIISFFLVSLHFAYIEEEDARGGQPYACMAVNDIMRDNAQGPLHFINIQGGKNILYIC